MNGTDQCKPVRIISLKTLITRPVLTTLLVSPGTEGLDLLGVEQPEHEILEQPEQHLPMHSRQRASRDGGGERPRREAEAGSSGKT